jgi:hypothetical protein
LEVQLGPVVTPRAAPIKGGARRFFFLQAILCATKIQMRLLFSNKFIGGNKKIPAYSVSLTVSLTLAICGGRGFGFAPFEAIGGAFE